eukprot:jgi/Ulvmu1/11559/UM079_0002.1
MELRNKRKGVPAQQQESRPSKDSSGNTSKRVKSRANNQPERASRRVRSRNGEAGPSSRHEAAPQETSAPEAGAHSSACQDIHISQRVKQEVLAEPDHVEEPARQRVMAGSPRQAEQNNADNARVASEDVARGSMSALQQLLSKIGSGIDEAGFVSLMAGTGMGGSKARFKEIINRLVTPESDAHLLTALEDLSTSLSMANEDQLLSFPMDVVAPVLVRCLRSNSHNPNTAVYAARIVAWLADISPQTSCTKLVNHNVITALCARLLDIEFIDVAESCLSALSKLSAHVPEACLRQGGMMATLSYLNFLPDVVQRTAVSTAAAMAARTTSETMPLAMEALPHLLALLDDCKDTPILNSACSALDHITSAATKEDAGAAIHQIAAYGVVDKALPLLDISTVGAVQSHLSSTSFFLLLSTATTCALNSADLAHCMLEGGLHVAVHSLLAHSGVALANNEATSAIRTQQQLAQVLQLLEAMLPQVPAVQLMVSNGSLAVLNAHAAEAGPAERIHFLQSHGEIRDRLCTLFLPLMHQIYTVHSSVAVRSKCITVLASLLHSSSSDHLAASLCDVPFSSFIKSLLHDEDADAVAAGIVFSQLLLHKIPTVFEPAFAKEGTYVALQKLAATAPPPPKPKLQVRTRSMAKAAPPASPDPEPHTTSAVACAVVARRLLAEHFRDSSRVETEGLATLRQLCDRLQGSNSLAAFEELLQILVDPSRISAFELHASGALPTLIRFLSGDGLGTDSQRISRLQAVLTLLMARPGNMHRPAVTYVARKLTSVLEALDEFDLKVNPAPRFVASAFSRGRSVSLANMSAHQQSLYALTQPVKLTLRSAPGSKLRDCTSSTVLVEPLARLTAVEDFVRGRIRPSSVHEVRVDHRSGSDTAPSTQQKPGCEAANPADRNAAAELSGSKRLTRSHTRVDSAKACTTRGLDADGSECREDMPPSLDSGNDLTAQMSAAEAVQQATRDARHAVEEDMRHQVEERMRAAHEMFAAGGAFDGDALDRMMAADYAGALEHHEDEDDMDDDDHMHDEDVDDEDMDEDGLGSSADLPTVQDLQLEDQLEGATPPPPPPPHALSSAGAAAPPRVNHGGADATEGAASGAPAASGGSGPPFRRSSSTAVDLDDRSVVLMVNGKMLPRSFNVLQAAMQAAQHSSGGSLENAGSLWGDVHLLHYALASEVPDAVSATGLSVGDPCGSSRSGAWPVCDRELHILNAVEAAAEVPNGLSDVPPCAMNCLVLLQLLERIITETPCASLVAEVTGGSPYNRPADIVTSFNSTRTNARLLHQLNDVIAICGNNLPPWVKHLPHSFKCLLPFETRRRFLLVTGFDIPRTLTSMQMLMREEGTLTDVPGGPSGPFEMRVARIQRQKVRVSRQRILDSAIKVFSMNASVRSVLEFEFFNEVGTGLGPTLEFYALLASELQRSSLGLWQDHHTAPEIHDKPPSVGTAAVAAASVLPSKLSQSSTPLSRTSADIIHSPAGLFPRPYMPGKCPKKVIATFDMMGKAVAKCFQDSRLMDLNLSLPFISLLQHKSLDFAHLEVLDSRAAWTLVKVKNAAKAARGRRTGKHSDGWKVEDLCLYFILPGYPEYELVPGGTDIEVTSRNAEEYCDLVVAAFLENGVRTQMDAFMQGFDAVFDSRKLNCIYEEEVEMLLRGIGEKWSEECVMGAIKCDHGYSRHSPAVQNFVRALTELSSEEQRAFLRFVTGSPRLPYGGIAALRPRLTIVKKHSGDDENGTHDKELPSVMTCANYIKLPQYSSQAVCARQLRLAYREGQGSFDLS